MVRHPISTSSHKRQVRVQGQHDTTAGSQCTAKYGLHECVVRPGLDEADEFDAVRALACLNTHQMPRCIWGNRQLLVRRAQDRGQPNRDEYLAACAKLLPLGVPIRDDKLFII